LVEKCTCVLNGKTGTASWRGGIVTSGRRNVVRGNHLAQNSTGIHVGFGTYGNQIIGNTLVKNDTPISVNLSADQAGPTITGPGTITSENPWANINLP
jgi:parallel beta-helix repeat protein